MYNIFQFQLRLGLLVATFGLVVSCLITNCPRGGKRGDNSLDKTSSYPDTNYCIPCGPDDQGVCLGKNVCCSREGCTTRSRYTDPCRSIQNTRISCLSEVNVQTCGDKGRCKAKFICCSRDQCVMDLSCKSMPPAKYRDVNEPNASTYNEQALSLLLQKNLKDMGELDQDIVNEIWKTRKIVPSLSTL